MWNGLYKYIRVFSVETYKSYKSYKGYRPIAIFFHGRYKVAYKAYKEWWYLGYFSVFSGIRLKDYYDNSSDNSQK